jgi:3' terminal RNA ribose 2'-O-methyltransferase Hen1
MLLTLTNSTPPATDLGFLLHKNPANVRSVPLAFGQAHVFFPDATDDRCTAALMLEIDPIRLVRRRGVADFALAPYVNDRPYVASSFMSVAIAKLFGTAMSGRSEERPELVDTPLDLSVRVPVLPSRGGEPLLRRLFEPLGYVVEATPIRLDPRFPEWGDGRCFDIRISASARLRDVLQHLYVLLPVLDDQKHYWVTGDEIEKLLNRGREWLADHPERELITRRYLRHPRLAREALSRLLEEDQPDPDEAEERHDREEEAFEERLRLRDERLGTVIAVLRSACPEGPRPRMRRRAPAGGAAPRGAVRGGRWDRRLGRRARCGGPEATPR